MLASSEGHVAPEMEGEARHQEAGADPTDQVCADCPEARPLGPLEVGQEGGRSQPNQRAENCVEPKRRGHSALLSPPRVLLMTLFGTPPQTTQMPLTRAENRPFTRPVINVPGRRLIAEFRDRP